MCAKIKTQELQNTNTIFNRIIKKMIKTETKTQKKADPDKKIQHKDHKVKKD